MLHVHRLSHNSADLMFCIVTDTHTSLQCCFRQRVNTSSGAVDPAGHPLVASTPDFDSFCNGCRREIHDAEIRHSCTACDYDLCNVCAVNATSTAVDTEMIKGMAVQAKNEAS